MTTESVMPPASTLTERLRLPVVAAPLFIVSGPDLVVAQCSAGVVGSFPALNARPGPVLEEWLDEIEERLADHDRHHPGRPSAPFAVNQIVHATNDRLEHDMAVCVEHEVEVVITSLGAREDVNEAVHSYGGVVLHDVIDNRFARKAIDKGADGLIAVAAGAGGHAGTQSPFALVQEIRQWFDGPLLLSGAISHGRSVLAARAAGADLAYVGSAFIATDEANAPDGYKDMLVESTARDIVYSNLFTGIHGNYLRGSIASAGLDPDDLPNADPSAMDFSLGDVTSAKAWRDVWGAGQGVGTLDQRVPTRTLVDRLVTEYEAARTALLAS